MKNRTGFVSNSSSSSFIISATPNEKGKVLISLDLTELGGEVVKTEYDLRNKFMNRYGPDYEKSTYHGKVFNRCLDIIKSDRAIIMGSIDRDMSGVLYYISGGSELIEIDE